MFFSNVGSSNDTSLYEELGVNKTATSAEIKRAYKKLALKFHPDRNKEPAAEERFKKISSAYEVLIDEEKRSNYDKFGLDAVKNGANMSADFGSGGNPFDIFENLFNNGPGNMRSQNTRKQHQGRSIVKEIEVELSDIYNETTLTMGLSNNVKCSACDGSGCKKGKSVKNCAKCDGSGVFVQIQQFGPGMISQSTQTCGDCRGKGKIIDPADVCLKCNGTKTESNRTKLDLNLSKTHKGGDKIVYNEMADYDPDVITQGDLIIVLKEKNNTHFERIDDELVYHKSITLLEALCGMNLSITHMDGREIFIKTSDVIQPESIYKVCGEGMTSAHNLYIKFNVVLPSALSEERKKYIKKLIQKSDNTNDVNDANNTTNVTNKEVKFLDSLMDGEYEILSEKLNANKYKKSSNRKKQSSHNKSSPHYHDLDDDGGEVPSCATQ